MGFIRGFALVIISVLLFVFLLATGFFITVSSSLSYDNVQPKISLIATEIIQEQIGEITIINTLTPYLKEYCNENSEVVQQFEGYVFVFPCDIITQGTESIVSYSVNYLVGDFYYKEYNCEFWNCFGESEIPLFLVSEKAKNYWGAWFFKAFLISLVLSAGAILLSKRKSRGFTLTGVLVILSSLIVLQLSKMGTFVAKLVLSPISSALSEETSQTILADVIVLFFSNSNTIFVWMFVIGLVLIVAGIILRLFRVGFKVSAFFKKIESKNEGKIKESKVVKEVKVENTKKK